MRYFEIILKLLFAVCGLYLIFVVTNNSGSYALNYQLFAMIPFSSASLLLGVVLWVNKKSSYNYLQSERDYKIRKIEGTLLIIFAVTMLFVAFKFIDHV